MRSAVAVEIMTDSFVLFYLNGRESVITVKMRTKGQLLWFHYNVHEYMLLLVINIHSKNNLR